VWPTPRGLGRPGVLTEQQPEDARAARGVAHPQGGCRDAVDRAAVRACSDVARERGQRLGKPAGGGMGEIRTADIRGECGRRGDGPAKCLEKRAPGAIIGCGAEQPGEEARDQVVARGGQAGTTADHALERPRRLVGLQSPGRAREAYALAIDGSTQRQGVRMVGARATAPQGVPCRAPCLGHRRDHQIDVHRRQFVTPGLRAAEIEHQPALDAQHVGATADPLADREMA
jgi:hypothetical protein